MVQCLEILGFNVLKACDCKGCVPILTYMYILFDISYSMNPESVCAITSTLKRAEDIILEFNEATHADYKNITENVWRIDKVPLNINLTTYSTDAQVDHNTYNGYGAISYREVDY